MSKRLILCFCPGSQQHSMVLKRRWRYLCRLFGVAWSFLSARMWRRLPRCHLPRSLLTTVQDSVSLDAVWWRLLGLLFVFCSFWSTVSGFISVYCLPWWWFYILFSVLINVVYPPFKKKCEKKTKKTKKLPRNNCLKKIIHLWDVKVIGHTSV